MAIRKRRNPRGTASPIASFVGSVSPVVVEGEEEDVGEDVDVGVVVDTNVGKANYISISVCPKNQSISNFEG
jgi:hypothetical protein